VFHSDHPEVAACVRTNKRKRQKLSGIGPGRPGAPATSSLPDRIKRCRDGTGWRTNAVETRTRSRSATQIIEAIQSKFRVETHDGSLVLQLRVCLGHGCNEPNCPARSDAGTREMAPSLIKRAQEITQITEQLTELLAPFSQHVKVPNKPYSFSTLCGDGYRNQHDWWCAPGLHIQICRPHAPDRPPTSHLLCMVPVGDTFATPNHAHQYYEIPIILARSIGANPGPLIINLPKLSDTYAPSGSFISHFRLFNLGPELPQYAEEKKLVYPSPAPAILDPTCFVVAFPRPAAELNPFVHVLLPDLPDGLTFDAECDHVTCTGSQARIVNIADLSCNFRACFARRSASANVTVVTMVVHPCLVLATGESYEPLYDAMYVAITQEMWCLRVSMQWTRGRVLMHATAHNSSALTVVWFCWCDCIVVSTNPASRFRTDCC